MRRLCLLQMARLHSERFPNKLLQEVLGVSLYRRGLSKLVSLSQILPINPIIACPGADLPLIDQADHHGVKSMILSPEAASGEDWLQCYGGLREILEANFDWVFTANFLCRPFLGVETMGLVLCHALSTDTPFVCTQLKRGIIWDASGAVKIGYQQTANTKTNDKYRQLAHLGYGVPVDMLGWDDWGVACSVQHFDVSLTAKECIDVDTPADLNFANALALGLMKGAVP